MTKISIRRDRAFRAIEQNNVSALTNAVKNQSEANWRAKGSETGSTLLEYACQLGYVEVATWLIDHGADIDAYCTEIFPDSQILECVDEFVAYSSPLWKAILFNQLGAFELLIRRGVNQNMPTCRFGSYVSTCRTFMAINPMFKAIVEKVLLEDEAALGEVAVRHRL